ncbi:MAG: dockerin type I domain-containing protein, partial [Planctomycetota bacterium]
LTTDQRRTVPRSVYGGVDLGATEAVLTGDANFDGEVNLTDFLVLRSNFGNTDSLFADGDFDGDGSVDLADFLLLRGNFGTSVDDA